MLTGIAAASCCIWVSLLLFQHHFWRTNQRLEYATGSFDYPYSWPTVTVIIPAHNEGTVLGCSLPTLLMQDYPGLYQIILVDDDSSDGTSIIAKAITEDGTLITCIHNTSLPDGWTRKLWAMMKGLQKSDILDIRARYILFTDADIVYAPWVLKSLVYKAEREDRHLVSIMTMLHCHSIWERLLVPSFTFFFRKRHLFPTIDKKIIGETGGCTLVRRDTLQRLGDFVLIRNAVIDNSALVRLVKTQGSIWTGLSTAVQSLHPYDSLPRFWSMIARTIFAQLAYRNTSLITNVLSMSLTCLVGPVTLIVGIIKKIPEMAFVGCISWVLMLAVYKTTCTLYRRPGWEGLGLPLAAFLYTIIILDSERKFQLKQWKERTHYLQSSSFNYRAISSIVTKAKTSFYLAMSLLGHRRKSAMFAIYAFCRIIDDIVDDIVDLEARRSGLGSWRRELLLLYKNGSNKPHHLITLILGEVSSQFGLRYDDYVAIIDGMEMDVYKPLHAPSLTVLDLYCDRVASAVGRLSVQVFGLPNVEGYCLSRTLGRALQITNILRDVDEDAKRGRLYLPHELLRLHNITHTLSTEKILKHTTLPNVYITFGNITYYYFNVSGEQLACCQRRQSRPAALMKAVYQVYLLHLLECNFIQEDKIQISSLEKFALVLCNIL